jgi:thioesterase domain-containing protein
MCGGAHIAFDMARLLEASSERVNLVIFDTWVWENTQNRALWRVDYFHNRIKTILKLPPPERSKALHRAFSTQFSRLLRQVPMVREHVQERPLADVWVRSYWPGSDFKPKTYSGRVAVFKRSRQPYYRIRDPYLGWGKRALGGVDLHLVSAPSHRDILREPYVAELANIILDWLAELPRSGRVS